MSLFRSEEEVQDWCRSTGNQPGETLGLEAVWDLAQDWYGNRMDPEYRGRTPGQVSDVFRRAGLTSSFWQEQ